MSSSAARVRSDDPTVCELVGAMFDLVHAHGGVVHQGLWVDERDGALSVHVDGGDGSTLIGVPLQILVPIDRVGIEAVGDELVVVTSDDDLTPVQREALDVHLRLYSATGKVRWARAALAEVAFADDPFNLEVLSRLRFREFGSATSVARTFLSTRTLSHRSASPESPVEGSVQPPAESSAGPAIRPVLMPLLDLVNHHPSAPPFRTLGRSLQVNVAHPAGGSEVFVSYGSGRCVIDVALRYGFVSEASRTTRFCPLDVEVDGLRIRIEGRSVRARSGFDAPTVAIEGSSLILSHLNVSADHPRRLEAALSLALQMASRARGGAASATIPTDVVLAELIRADRKIVDSVVSDLTSEAPVRGVIAHALSVHRAIIDEASLALRIDA